MPHDLPTLVSQHFEVGLFFTKTYLLVLLLLPIAQAVIRSCCEEKVFLESSQNSLENTAVRVFFNKVAGLRPATLLKKRLWHRCFPMNYVKFLRMPFSTEHRW